VPRWGGPSVSRGGAVSRVSRAGDASRSFDQGPMTPPRAADDSGLAVPGTSPEGLLDKTAASGGIQRVVGPGLPATGLPVTGGSARCLRATWPDREGNVLRLARSCG
jgi:hypothetical protein